MEPVPLPIRTERLVLRRPVLGDVRALHAIQSREDVTRWLPWGPRTEDQVRAKLQDRLVAPLEDELFLVIEHEGVLVGTVNVLVASAEHRQVEVGYVLHPDHAGRGFATEAARAMVDLAFAHYGAHRVCGRIEPRNTASARVLERLGMRKEAHLVENERIGGEWQDEAIYAVLDREWRAAR